MHNLPVALAEIIAEPKESFSFLISPFNHFHYHVMIVVHSLIANDLLNQNVVNYEIREPLQFMHFIGAQMESIIKWFKSSRLPVPDSTNKLDFSHQQTKEEIINEMTIITRIKHHEEIYELTEAKS